MHPIDESAIRGSFLNASLRERQNLLLPADFGELD
ncbi:FBP domain-containing protein, partial [Schumannella sp. 10F1B-5-1]